MANQHAQEVRHNTAAKRRQQADQDRLQRFNQQADLISQENHFNFIKMHYQSYFSSHIQHFVSIRIYSTKISELAHKEQIKEGYCQSNKNKATRQILSHYGYQHALGKRLQTPEKLFNADSAISIDIGGGEVRASSRSIRYRVLKGQKRNIGMQTELCRTCDIDYDKVIEEMLCFIQRTVVDDPPLHTDATELVLLHVEQFTHLQIPVADSQETDVFQIHGAGYTRTNALCNSGPRNDWIWLQAQREESY